MTRRGKDERELPHGKAVRIDAHVGDDASGDLRGQAATVHGVNATFVNQQGVPMVNVRTEAGEVLAVPQAAVKERRR